ncbi:hypothetical protein SUGI_0477810 [Cryptomeria japonica]|uniref:uncharacterized protein LOC131043292 isoform X2 n=1 Tax=Cryptomeria japonica TaxID=3369 RepID=UPI002408F1B2|nr:uncharacterized protein LOC131043292 isoform X2 [Cryptomeria japonica]GLJ24959.1 hypothetical protein SUGI_0477810 [Cryptomeria japonica]
MIRKLAPAVLEGNGLQMVRQESYPSNLVSRKYCHGHDKEKEETSERSLVSGGEEERGRQTWWIPHAKSGIFHPEGQHKLIQDVAAPSKKQEEEQTLWLRSSSLDD